LVKKTTDFVHLHIFTLNISVETMSLYINQGLHKMKTVQKFLVDMLDAWIEGRKKYLEYKRQQ
jgi:hypothetical protein